MQYQSSKIFYNPNIKEILEKAIQLDLPVLMIGETGTGKSSYVKKLAATTGNTLIRSNLTGQTGVDQLVGRYLANDKGTYWIDGVLIQAMKNGWWIVLDEINMALPEVLSKLHSLLDDDRKIILDEKEGEVIEPHPNFRFFATMNPSDEYAGTKELNKAFISRFPIILDIDYSNKEIQILTSKTGIDEEMAKNLVHLAKEIRQQKKKEQLTYPCSTRDLLYAASLIQAGLSKEIALATAIINKASIEEKEPILKLCELIMGEKIVINEEIQFKSITEVIKEFQNLTEGYKNLEKNYKEITDLKNILDKNCSEQIDALNGFKKENNELKQEKENLEKKLSAFEIVAEEISGKTVIKRKRGRLKKEINKEKYPLKISPGEYKKRARVGDMIITNLNSNYVEEGQLLAGYVGEIIDEQFYVWQNEKDGTQGKISPKTKNYEYSYICGFDCTDKKAIIEITESSYHE